MPHPAEGVEVEHAEFPAGKIRHYRSGDGGPAIVLLHGGGFDNAMVTWRHTIPMLAEDHRVFLFDLPGQGGSRPWHGRADQRTLEEVVRWMFDVWGLDDAVLVGHSIGGSVAAGFTLRHPRRVHGLVLVDSAGFQTRMPRHLPTYLAVRSGLGTLATKVLGRNRAFTGAVLARSILTGGATVPDLGSLVDEVKDEARQRQSVFPDWLDSAITRKGLSVNHLPRADRIHCPTLVLHGEQDAVTSPASAREAAGAIAGSRLRAIEGAGHWPARERPTEFNAALRKFVNELQGDAGADEPETS
ncbi:alpha/beta fold hydrolase [Allosaccharopolyspora coralli]|uniref:Alpha/beta fold hydrolase n=1 Tax=Allosaccharopolyspora coralli TaxID=2665642 RepID=A0A5Q3Q9Y8_9PSEU|nr:alpha/beta hydrolase [Allosaccharopolyspora coralli]QGK71183.1 alpha/beta fold hydrolase [Allosaccharopolyspora coralli]